MAFQAPFCPPSHFFVPRAFLFYVPYFMSFRGVSRGTSSFDIQRSLGTCVPRNDTVEGCHPEHSFLSPRAIFLSPRGVSRGVSQGTPSRTKRGVPRRLRASGRHGGRLSPRALFFVTPSRFFCHSEASAEGSHNSFYPPSISLLSSSVRPYSL